MLDGPIAHRGLFDQVVPENSLPAFQLAIDKGYTIELDVQPSKDGSLMVFHDQIGVAWFKKEAPDLPRGILSGTFTKDADQLAGYEKFALKHLLLNFIAKPQFIAYELEGLPQARVQSLRARGIPVLAWTVEDAAQLAKAQAYSDNVIFDTFRFPV